MALQRHVWLGSFFVGARELRRDQMTVRPAQGLGGPAVPAPSSLPVSWLERSRHLRRQIGSSRLWQFLHNCTSSKKQFFSFRMGQSHKPLGGISNPQTQGWAPGTEGAIALCCRRWRWIQPIRPRENRLGPRIEHIPEFPAREA